MIKVDKSKPIAITGGTGFVGQNLIKSLVRNGYKINLLAHQHKFNYPRVKVIQGDLVSAKGLEEFLKESKIVIHLAGRFIPPNSEIFKNNVVATFNLLEKCAEHRVEKIIFSSGVALYGEPPGRAWREDDIPRPNTVYGLSKFLAEKIIEYWGEKESFKYFFLRFPNIYGPGQKKGVIFNFLKAVKEKGKVVIFGDGKQERDFIFIDDAIEAIIKALNYSEKSDVFNIGTGKTTSLFDLVKNLEEVLEKKIQIEFKKPEGYVVRKLWGDVTKANKVLGWEAKVSLNKGLQETNRWFQKEYE